MKIMRDISIQSFDCKIHYWLKMYDKLDEKIVEALNLAVEKINGKISGENTETSSSVDSDGLGNFFIDSVVNCLKVNPEYNTSILVKLLFLLIPNSSSR